MVMADGVADSIILIWYSRVGNVFAITNIWRVKNTSCNGNDCERDNRTAVLLITQSAKRHPWGDSSAVSCGCTKGDSAPIKIFDNGGLSYLLTSTTLVKVVFLRWPLNFIR